MEYFLHDITIYNVYFIRSTQTAQLLNAIEIMNTTEIYGNKLYFIRTQNRSLGRPLVL